MEPGILGTILQMIQIVGPVETDLSAAYADAMKFLASPPGQDLERILAQLFTHTATPGAAVVVEPRA